MIGIIPFSDPVTSLSNLLNGHECRPAAYSSPNGGPSPFQLCTRRRPAPEAHQELLPSPKRRQNSASRPSETEGSILTPRETQLAQLIPANLMSYRSPRSPSFARRMASAKPRRTSVPVGRHTDLAYPRSECQVSARRQLVRTSHFRAANGRLYADSHYRVRSVRSLART